jgi:hypothetical protein
MDRADFRQRALQRISELAAECVLMDARQYEDFKTGATQACDDKAKPFLCQVLSIIDTVRRRKDNA